MADPVSLIANTILYVTGAYSATATAAAYVFAQAAVYVAGTFALAKASELLLGKPKIGRPRQDVEYFGTVESRRIIYGQMKVSGLNVIPPLTSGNKNTFLHQVLALAGHELNSITTVYFNQEAVGTIGAITGSSSDGLVSSGTFQNRAWVRRYDGTQTTSDYILNSSFGEWTSDHIGKGVAYLALTYEFDQKVYTTGKPEISCLVTGKKVYDPRKDSTQTAISGSGSHRLTDPSTFEYSNNPALCLADYLLSTKLGLGEETSRINWAAVAAAADICEETVTVPNGSGGSTTQNRYTCNTVLLATDRFEDNIEVLTTAMMGTCYYSGGEWHMYAGAWRAPSFTLTDDDIVEGGVSVTTALPYNERYNGVRGKFIDASQNYQMMEFPAVQSATYVTNDGEAAWREVEWPSTTNVYEAQRNAILTLRQSRNSQTATLACGMSAWGIRPSDIGQVTISELGWTNKYVRVQGWKFDPTGVIELLVREEASTDWSDPILTDYTEPLAISNITPPEYAPDPPTNLTATGTGSGISLTWTAPTDLPLGAVYQVFEYTSSTPFASATKVFEGNATSVFLPKSSGTTYYYWVKVVTVEGYESETEPVEVGVPGSATGTVGGLAVSVSTGSVSAASDTATVTSGNVTATASSGTPTYTYAWTKVSGGSITATAASSATTAFEATSLTSGETRTAIFRVTATDSASPQSTATADVSVSIRRVNFSATASPASLYKSTTTSSGTTSSTTVTPVGGVSTYSYSWARISGSALISANSPTAATTTFTGTGLNEGDFITAQFRCTVTDSSSPQKTATADVWVTIERPDGGGAIP